jgi:pimeloyl-ACP methyl ester carboxylesterase
LRTVDPRLVTTTNDGIEIAALDWGGDGPPLLLQHPNGFCAGLFDPLAQALRDEFRCVAVDVRGHGASETPADLADCTFEHGAHDVLAVLDVLGLDEVVALGESSGGGITLIADSLRPGLVRKILLCEAIAFPPVPREVAPGNAMATAARKRRAVWPDRAAVRASYGSRPPLGVMEPAALAAYARYGFRDRDDGTVELACAPEVEARWFECAREPEGAPLAFARLVQLEVPITIVVGSDTYLPSTRFVEQAAACNGTYVEVTGGHFFVQEDAERAAGLVRRYLSW